jgi:hypothetical protein
MQSLKRITSFIRAHILPLSIIVLGTLASALIVSRSFGFLLSNIIPDDAFYYFQIARNAANGLGSTFDGVGQTNGYHPLWLVILIGIYKLFSTGGVMDTTPIYIALWLQVILNFITGIILLIIIQRYTKNTFIQAAALFVWFFNPFMLYQMANGLETALAMVLTVLFFLFVFINEQKKETRFFVVTAITGGLMVLARLDTVFFLAAYYLWLLFNNRSKENTKKAFLYGFISFLIIVPWFVWNYIHFGMFLTSASGGNTLVNRVLIVQDHGKSTIQTLKAAVYSTYYGLETVTLQTGAPVLVFIAIGLAIAFCIEYKQKFKALFNRADIVLFLGFVGMFIANSSIRWTVRPWYFLSLNIFLSIFIAWILDQVFKKISYKKTTASILILLTLFFYYVNWSKNLRDSFSPQQEMLAATEWANTHLPAGVIMGSFNAGIQGYFSTHRLFNLDGLVNNKAYTAMEEYKLWSYIKSQKIQYISDFPIYLSYRYKSFFDTPNIFNNLEPIQTISIVENTNSRSGIVIYKVK